MLSAVKPTSQPLTTEQVSFNPPAVSTEQLLKMGILATNQTIYVNALDLLPSAERYSYGAVNLGLMMINRKTDERLMVDLLTPNDRLATILQIVRLHFPSNEWLFSGDTWEIPTSIEMLAAA